MLTCMILPLLSFLPCAAILQAQKGFQLRWAWALWAQVSLGMCSAAKQPEAAAPHQIAPKGLFLPKRSLL